MAAGSEIMIVAVRTSETSVYIETMRRYIPEGFHPHTGPRENVRSHAGLLYPQKSLARISATREVAEYCISINILKN
jgi:hypothetical protein